VPPSAARISPAYGSTAHPRKMYVTVFICLGAFTQNSVCICRVQNHIEAESRCSRWCRDLAVNNPQLRLKDEVCCRCSASTACSSMPAGGRRCPTSAARFVAALPMTAHLKARN
jgi:hypothetical protein